MSITFDPNAPIVVVPAIIVGPLRTIRVELALDTGAGQTSIRPRFLVAAGYNPVASTRRKHFRSATGDGIAPLVDLPGITCLGHLRPGLTVLAHDLPPAVTYDGLLGLDFFRGFKLTLDFTCGRISLAPPKHWWQFWR